MSLIKNVGIGKRAYTLQYDVNFSALKEDFLSEFVNIRQQWDKKGLLPTKKEVENFVQFCDDPNVRFNSFSLGYWYGGIAVTAYMKSEDLVRTFTVVEVYKDVVYINKCLIQYMKRIKNLGGYDYIKQNSSGFYVLKLKH